MPTKLHALLAVETNLRGQSNKLINDLSATFRSKSHLFEEKRKTFVPLAENEESRTEIERSIQTTVPEEIAWISKHLTKALDAAYQVDLANMTATSDVVAEDGTALLKDVPTAALQRLAREFEDIKALIGAIPTLDPAKGFTPDADSGKHRYQARPVVKDKTRKEKKVLTLASATDKHPAQAQAYDADVVVGRIEEQEWSGMITPAMKADVLDRVEILIRALKSARARANEQQIETSDKMIGKKLLDYVFQPLGL